MKQSYKIEVDCANCANLIEVEASKIKGVKSVSVNFITQKMEIEFLDDVDSKKVMKEIIKNWKKILRDYTIVVLKKIYL